MSTEISSKIQELPRLHRPKLRALWQELFAKPKLRRNPMIPILAYRLQERAYGGLKPSTCKCLQKLAAELEQNQKASVRLGAQLKPGTKLLRQWQGEMHAVLVVAEGFEYRENAIRAFPRLPARSRRPAFLMTSNRTGRLPPACTVRSCRATQDFW